MHKDTRTWERTLGVDPSSDKFADDRALFNSAFEAFRARVSPLAAEIALSVPNYTDHSIAHCDSLWSITDQIITEDYPLNPAEAFVLGGAFLVHDLGMGLAAHSKGLVGILGNENWLDLLAGMYPKDYQRLQETALADAQINPNWDGLTDPRVKFALTGYLRETHAEQAENVVSESWQLTNDEHYYLLENSQLRHWYGQLIGQLGRSHWMDVETLPTLFSTPLGKMPQLAADWTVDALKLACILRTADASQIDGRRADPMHTPFRNPQGLSRDHWVFQERMFHPQRDNDRLVFTSSNRFQWKHSGAWWLAYDTTKMVNDELRKVDALFADLGRPRLAARSVAGVETPARFSKYLPVEGWSPVDARPSITDQDSIIKSLGGTALYGEGSDVAIRELLANAVDATRLLRAAYPDANIRPIRLSFIEAADCDYFQVEDFGIGMTEQEIVHYLCDFGKSGWADYATRTRYPGALASGFRSAGMYGIGFFSSFMASSDVQVLTRSATGGPPDTLVLHFDEGLDGRPTLRLADRKERRLEHGTRVTLKLTHRATDSDGVMRFYRRAALKRQLKSIIERLALLCEEKIEVSAWSEPFQECQLLGDEWKEANALDLVMAIIESDPGSDHKDEIPIDLVREVARRLSPIYDTDGQLVGRIALTVDIEDQRPWGFGLGSANVYAGGFVTTSPGHSYFGILTGAPETAARMASVPNFALDEVRRWLEGQLDLIGLQNLTEDVQARIAGMALALGIRLSPLPIAFSSSGPLTPEGLSAWVAERSSIILLDDVIDIFEFDSNRYGFVDTTARGIVEIPDDCIATAWSSGYWARALAKEEQLKATPEFAESEASTRWGTPLSTWWEQNCHSALGECIRLIAANWAVPMTELMTACEWYGSGTKRGQFERLVGPGGRLTSVNGFVVRR